MFCLSAHMESSKDCKGQGYLFFISEGLNIATFLLYFIRMYQKIFYVALKSLNAALRFKC